MKTYPQLKAEAESRTRQVTPRQVLDTQDRGEPVVLVDVREIQEVNAVKIPGSVHVPRSHLESRIEAQVARDANVVVYCGSGNRSVLAADTLQTMGYSTVASMSGGIRAWADAGGEVE
ncbi:MAG TPA: rhodanese-like domain-containing protein [Gemmatimonadaceae bacterium]|jgi:rhodanese-related sulfurtransferase